MGFMEVQNMLLPFYGWRTIGGVIALIGGLIVTYDIILIGKKKTT